MHELEWFFQKPNVFPKSIFDNVAYGSRLQGVRNKQKLGTLVEKSLKNAAIWDEVKDRLHTNALGMSGRSATTHLYWPAHWPFNPKFF